MKSTILELASVAIGARAEGERTVVQLADNREVSFPVSHYRKLREAKPGECANIEIICGGTGSHWPELDEDQSVLGILEGRLGRA